MRGLAADVDAAEALAAAAGAGPYFALKPWAEGAGWRQASLLVSDPAVLADRVTHACAVIVGRAGIAAAEVAERIAASIVFLGLAARLVSPSLGVAVLGGVVRYLALDDLWWRLVDGGPVPLAARPGHRAGDRRRGPDRTVAMCHHDAGSPATAAACRAVLAVDGDTPARHVVLGFAFTPTYGGDRSWFCGLSRVAGVRGNPVGIRDCPAAVSGNDRRPGRA